MSFMDGPFSETRLSWFLLDSLSEFAVIFDGSNTPVDPGVLDLLMNDLSHCRQDGNETLISGNFAMGHCHSWRTPEEVGERQPVSMTGLSINLVMDGRLNNRVELIKELPAEMEGETLSDAELVLRAYSRWGQDLCEHLLGEFALVIYDRNLDQIISFRDQLGNRTLFYGWRGTCLLIATEPWPIANVIHGSAILDESALAHFFAIDPSPDGQTLFKGVKELLPAHMMTVNGSAAVHKCYWEPDVSQKLRYKHDNEYSDHFLDLLEQSVKNCLRSNGKFGMLMSGGMDSTSLASLAARMIAPERLDTFSFVFNELKDCDESNPILEVQKQWGLDSRLIPCDDLWPFKDLAALPFNPNFPEVNLYRQVKERIYQAASNAGVRVLLTGGFGDHLYAGEGDWLLDLFLDGKIFTAGREMLHQVRDHGWKRFLLSGYVRRLGRHLVTPFRGNKNRAPGQKPGWLTEYSQGLLSKEIFAGASYPGYYPSMLGLLVAQSATIENFPAGRYGLELRHPFRDLRLLEFVLSIPAYQLIRNEQKKYILRNAMRGILPESVRTMPKTVSLNSLFKRGIEVEGAKIESTLKEPGGQWKKYVNQEWLKDHWQNGQVSDGPGSLLPWLCISFESWYKLLG